MNKSKGVWTICVHPNTAHGELFNQLRDFLHKHSAQFSSIDHVLAEFDSASLSLTETERQRPSIPVQASLGRGAGR